MSDNPPYSINIRSTMMTKDEKNCSMYGSPHRAAPKHVGLALIVGMSDWPTRPSSNHLQGQCLSSVARLHLGRPARG